MNRIRMLKTMIKMIKFKMIIRMRQMNKSLKILNKMMINNKSQIKTKTIKIMQVIKFKRVKRIILIKIKTIPMAKI